jgi:Leucine-rich repeat (LRR) protein
MDLPQDVILHIISFYELPFLRNYHIFAPSIAKGLNAAHIHFLIKLFYGTFLSDDKRQIHNVFPSVSASCSFDMRNLILEDGRIDKSYYGAIIEKCIPTSGLEYLNLDNSPQFPSNCLCKFSDLQVLYMRGTKCRYLAEDIEGLLGSAKHLSSLFIAHAQFPVFKSSSSFIATFSKNTKLRALDLRGQRNLDNESISFITQRMPSLTNLKIQQPNLATKHPLITREAFAGIHNLQNLRELQITVNNVTYDSISDSLLKLGLKRFHLGNNSFAEGDGPIMIPQTLKRIELSSTDHVPDDCLQQNTQLKHLLISSNSFKKEFLNNLAAITTVEHLEVYNVDMMCTIMHELLYQAPIMANLKKLVVAAKMNDLVLKSILKTATRLTSLTILCWHIFSMKTVRVIAEHPSLTELLYSYSRFGDDGAELLFANTKLTSLDLSFSNLTDDSISKLAQNTSLTSLVINGNTIGERGLDALMDKNTTLTALSVRENKQPINCRQVTNTNLTILDLSYCEFEGDQSVLVRENAHIQHLLM